MAGQTAALPSNAMTSRRLMGSPLLELSNHITILSEDTYLRGLEPAYSLRLSMAM
jgi:hypothetical protein